MDLNTRDIVIFGNEFAISNCFSSGVQEGSRVGECSRDDDRCELMLGLGLYSNNHSSIGQEATDPLAQQVPSLATDVDPAKLCLRLGSELDDPGASREDGNMTTLLDPRYDEGSTSAKLGSGWFMPSLFLAPRPDDLSLNAGVSTNSSSKQPVQGSPEISAATVDCSVELTGYPATVDKARDLRSHQHPTKKCRFNGCSKGARGSTGLCIAHGGGQRCLKPGCHKGAESRTAFCKSHGGGRRCQQLGCTKSAEGRTEFCIAHGGGRRCGNPGCTKAARGSSGLCIRHGGGKRCSVEGCSRSAEGQLGRCISHGGGRRCQHRDCTKGAQGSTMYCKAHGGGKRCMFEGCTKGAEGSTPLCKAHGGGKRCLYDGGEVCPKSVHGGTDYCVAHGGGKRCNVPGCTKSARGRTDCCVRHGGGKRCIFENCAKSAQGSTDYCKAHGGGKRCNWSQGCEKFARGRSGLCAAHGSAMAARKDMDPGMFDPGIPRGLVSHSTTCTENEYACSTASTSSRSMGTVSGLIPPQVLVPIAMKSPLEAPTSRTSTNYEFVVPEGRVHGGGLMSLLGGNFHFSVDSDQPFHASDSSV